MPQPITARDRAKSALKHYLYTAGNPYGLPGEPAGLRPHPDVDREIAGIVDDIVEAAKEAVLDCLCTNASGSVEFRRTPKEECKDDCKEEQPITARR